MRRNLRSTLTFLLGWPLSFVALIFLTRSFLSRTNGVTLDFNHVHISLIVIGLLSFAGYYFLRSYIWYSLLKSHGNKLDLAESLFNWSFAQLKRYIPGNIWGIVGVSLHFSQKNVSKKDLSSSFVTETILVLLTASFVSLLGLPLIISTLHISSFESFIRNIGTILLIVVTLLYMFSGSLVSKIKLPKIVSYALAPFSFSRLASLWGLMLLSFICYGIGTYLIVTSFVYIDPHLFWTLVGYFVFSLLLGFVSFITPTGLGVREGAMALGLSSLIASPIASFVSLFARFSMIISELLFLALAYLFHKTKYVFIKKGLLWIQTNPQTALLILGYILFVLYFAFISSLRYENFYAGRFDLGNMEQTVWNTLHGNIFQFTNPNGTTIVSRLAFHADFILVLFAPLYFFWQDPRMLLVSQAVITGGGAFFVYLLAKNIIKNKNLALLFALLYFLNPSLERSVIYDFHAVTLATSFLLGAFYFMYRKKYGWFILFSILAAITKEQIWAIIALFGLYIFIFQKKKLLGGIVFIVSSLTLYLLIWKIIPQAAGMQHFALSYYSNGEVTDSPTTLIEQFLFSPLRTFELIIQPARLNYLNALFSPLGYLAVLSPLFLFFAGPDLTINLLSTKAELYQIYYQYTAAITPFIFIASIFGAAFILKRIRFITPFILAVYLIGSGIYTSYLYGPLPGAKSPNLDMITKVNSDKNKINSVLSDIPSNYSVATSNSLGSHVTHRQYLFTIPYGWDDADYVIFLKNETNAYPSLTDHLSQITKLSTSSAYIKYFDDGTLVAFRKKSIPLPQAK
jgi:uncharacterized membrane protein